MAYQCQEIASDNTCILWVQGFSWSDLAITGTQASQIIIAVASYYLTMWLLQKLRQKIF